MNSLPPLQPQERVRLGALVDQTRSDGRLILTSLKTEVSVEGPNSLLDAICAAVEPSQPEELANRHQVDTSVLLDCFLDVSDSGMLLRTSAERDAHDVDSYLALFHTNCEVLAAEALEGPFWTEMIAGRAAPAVVRGWGVEFFHFINRSNEYMPLAVAQTSLPTALRIVMAQHCVEESNHGGIFLDGLRRVGLPEDAVVESVPLPTTAALLDFLTELACQDTLAYLATFGVMQQDHARPAAGEYARFKDHMCSAYPDLAPLFEALHTHSMIDDELDHDELVFDTVIRAAGLPAAHQRSLIAAATRRFSWAFNEFFQGIHRWYGSGAVVVPRRPLAVAQFL